MLEFVRYTNFVIIIIIIIIDYNLRERHHNKCLIPKTADLNERDFLIQNL